MAPPMDIIKGLTLDNSQKRESQKKRKIQKEYHRKLETTEHQCFYFSFF
jgi:hypothetical protein